MSRILILIVLSVSALAKARCDSADQQTLSYFFKSNAGRMDKALAEMTDEELKFLATRARNCFEYDLQHSSRDFSRTDRTTLADMLTYQMIENGTQTELNTRNCGKR